MLNTVEMQLVTSTSMVVVKSESGRVPIVWRAEKTHNTFPRDKQKNLLLS